MVVVQSAWSYILRGTMKFQLCVNQTSYFATSHVSVLPTFKLKPRYLMLEKETQTQSPSPSTIKETSVYIFSRMQENKQGEDVEWMEEDERTKRWSPMVLGTRGVGVKEKHHKQIFVKSRKKNKMNSSSPPPTMIERVGIDVFLTNGRLYLSFLCLSISLHTIKTLRYLHETSNLACGF